MLLARGARTAYLSIIPPRNLCRVWAPSYTVKSVMEDALKAQDKRAPKQDRKDRKDARSGGQKGSSAKLRGHPRDTVETRMSKTLSWILRHGSQSEGIAMRIDGYVRVKDLLNSPKMKDLNFSMLEQIVSKDNKSRYHMLFEPDKTSNSPEEIWWIRANQGHSLKSVVLDLQPIESAADIPTGTAVHGTTLRAWELIREQGLSKMKRNHIHLAQGVPGSGVISGMRNSSQILIYINVQKALDAGIKFYISANGVVLTEGDEHGHLSPQFFAKVETADRKPIPGWEILPEVQKLSKPTTVEAEGVQGAGAIAEDITKNSLTDEPQTTEALVL